MTALLLGYRVTFAAAAAVGLRERAMVASFLSARSAAAMISCFSSSEIFRSFMSASMVLVDSSALQVRRSPALVALRRELPAPYARKLLAGTPSALAVLLRCSGLRRAAAPPEGNRCLQLWLLAFRDLARPTAELSVRAGGARFGRAGQGTEHRSRDSARTSCGVPVLGWTGLHQAEVGETADHRVARGALDLIQRGAGVGEVLLCAGHVSLQLGCGREARRGALGRGVVVGSLAGLVAGKGIFHSLAAETIAHVVLGAERANGVRAILRIEAVWDAVRGRVIGPANRMPRIGAAATCGLVLLQLEQGERADAAHRPRCLARLSHLAAEAVVREKAVHFRTRDAFAESDLCLVGLVGGVLLAGIGKRGGNAGCVERRVGRNHARDLIGGKLGVLRLDLLDRRRHRRLLCRLSPALYADTIKPTVGFVNWPDARIVRHGASHSEKRAA